MPDQDALVWLGGPTVAVVPVPVPELRPGWVPVDVAYAGICGTDLHIAAGEHVRARPGVVLGRRVGVRSRVGKAVAVRGSTTEEAALDLRLGCHGRTHTDLDAGAFPLRHAAKDRHHKIVRLRVGIDQGRPPQPAARPLLVIQGIGDNTSPPATNEAAFKLQQKNPGVTELASIENRGHSITIDSGWREVCDTALTFIKRFA